MEAILTFIIAFVFSFIGTIPPGTLNLSIIQMGLAQRSRQAWRFSLAASVVEYFYAWIAVAFENLLTSSTAVTENFELITGLVMLALGLVSLLSAKNKSPLVEKFNESGIRKGFILGILNPMALPFWLAMTAYIRGQRWVSLDTALELHAYLFGVAMGAFALMMVFFFLARKVVEYLQGNTLLTKIPGITLMVLGVYALFRYLT